jgi:hypothetical protein
MAEFDLATVMDAIANQLTSANIVAVAHAWPVPAFNPPCAIVGWPSKIDFDMTFKRGADVLTFPIWFAVSEVHEESGRAALSTVISGAVGIKTALDGNLGGVIDSGEVQDCVIEYLEMPNGPTYLTAKFTYEVIA